MSHIYGCSFDKITSKQHDGSRPPIIFGIEVILFILELFASLRYIAVQINFVAIGPSPYIFLKSDMVLLPMG